MITDTKITMSISGVPQELKQKLEALAEQDRRKLSAYICLLLEKHVQAVEAFDLAEKTPTPTAA